MKLLHSLPPYNFAGLSDASFSSARFIVLPVPYDGTASYGTGAKDAPHAIISASRFLELYDPVTRRRPADAGIFTLDELEPARGDARETTRRIDQVVSQILEGKKVPVTLGGDHSVAIGCVQAAAHHVNELSVVSFDAHLDCWPEYEGSTHSHASVGARIADLTPSIQRLRVNEVIVGCRNAGKDEIAFCDAHHVKRISSSEVRKNMRSSLQDILRSLKRNVYLTFDFDVLDPSIMPSVGTPEPDGLSYEHALSIIGGIASKRNVVGMDFCELAPIPGIRSPDFVAAKIVYASIGAVANGMKERQRAKQNIEEKEE